MAMYNTGQTAEPAAVDAQLLDMRPKRTVAQGLVSFVRTKPLGAISAGIIILTILTAITSPVITPHDPLDLVHEPFIAPQPGAWLGADELGRDVLSRIIYGRGYQCTSAC